ncbi:1639_t:CDS:10 [Diversispora eburnea]|uniref:1639_t:CDS:1 n=1 Tax=Diversispora eburnea TaxID=1213867 RepID=A0A9N8VQZ6_9GLOM|nr:1639_t:CDS:10 [Diversispora eburnea]
MSRLEKAKEAIENGISQYLQKIEQDPMDNNKAYQIFEATLEDHLSNPSEYSEQEQIDLLNCLFNNNDNKNQILDTFSWTIFSMVVPYLSQNNKSSIIALKILEAITQNNVRETYTMIFERLGLLDWENPNVSVPEFSGLIKILKIAFQRSFQKFKRNMFLKFFSDTLRYIARIWLELDNLQERNLDLVIESLIDFTETVSQTIDFEKEPKLTLTPTPEDISSQEFLLITFLLITSFEHYLLTVDIQMSSIYYEKLHPKFNVPWKKKQSENVKSVDQSRISRLIRAAKKSKISTTQIINYFEKFKPNKKVSKENLFSDSPDSMFRRIIPIANKVLVNDVNEYVIVDKVLLVLMYLADKNEENTITILNLNANLTQDGITLSSLFQALSSFASTSSDESLRFNSHQLLFRIISLCTDDAKMFLLKELLTNCPFEQMKSATIGMLKEIVIQRLNEAYSDKSKEFELSVFASPYLIEGFFPHILRLKSILNESSSSIEELEKEFIEKHSFLMHGLNFYMLLLMRDDKNLDTQKEFLDPLKDTCTEIIVKQVNRFNHLKELNSEMNENGEGTLEDSSMWEFMFEVMSKGMDNIIKWLPGTEVVDGSGRPLDPREYQPSIWNFLYSNHLYLAIFVNVLNNRINAIVTPRNPRPLPKTTRLLIRLPCFYLMAKSTLVLLSRLVISAAYLQPYFSQWIIELGEDYTDHQSLWLCLKALAIVYIMKAFHSSLENRSLPGREQSTTLYEYALLFHYFCNISSGSPNTDLLLIAIFEVVDIFLLEVLYLHPRGIQYRLIPTSIIGITGIVHYAYALFNKSDTYPMLQSFARFPELALIAIIFICVFLHAIAYVITGGNVRRTFFLDARSMPGLQEDYTMALYRIGTIVIETSRIDGYRNELPPIFVPLGTIFERTKKKKSRSSDKNKRQPTCGFDNEQQDTNELAPTESNGGPRRGIVWAKSDSTDSENDGDIEEIIPGDELLLLGNDLREHEEQARLTQNNMASSSLDESVSLMSLITERRQPLMSSQAVTDRLCVVCHGETRQCLLKPCGCFALCNGCREMMAQRKFKACPCCRRTVEGYSRVYIP